ncbi:hydroxyphenylacetyl-CoA thioesterase PaaI [Nocardioides bigeumensis]|uniref:Hydroxyphenylacetyl-CoA thioesterase PaaI n=1 Tax=Nocardioides bigeumensis TaxID=433657 RepID=A0ABN2YX50_9ACTN
MTTEEARPDDRPNDRPDHVRRMWADDRASQALGMRLEVVGEGMATVSMPVTSDMANGHGIGHGGLTFSVADTAFAFACNSYGPVTVAHSAEIRFHAPVHVGEVLVATARERSREGRRGLYDVEVTVEGRLVASFLGRSTTLREGADR